MANSTNMETSTLSNWSCPFHESGQSLYQWDVHNVVAVALPLTILAGLWSLVSNMIVIVAILREGITVRPAFVSLCSITLTDVVWGGAMFSFGFNELVSGSFCLSSTHIINTPWSVPCIVAFASTIGSLTVMTVDRYIAVAKATQYRFLITRQWVFIACSSVWVTSLFSALLRFTKVIPNNVFAIVLGIPLTICGLLMIIIQVLTLHFLRRHNNHVAAITAETNQVNPAVNAANAATERQLTVTTSYVVGVLCIVQIPGLVFRITKLPIYKFMSPFFLFTQTLASGINPLLYYRGNLQVRNGIKKILRCPPCH